jgi:hypothetical protein
MDPTPNLPQRPHATALHASPPEVQRWIQWLEGAGRQAADCYAGRGEFEQPGMPEDYEMDDGQMAVAMFQLDELLEQVPR